MTSHGQIRVNVDVEVTNHIVVGVTLKEPMADRRWADNAGDNRCVPHELRLVTVELQTTVTAAMPRE